MDTYAYTEIVAVTLVLLYVLAIVSALESILQGRTSQGSIAWTISLLSMPWLAVPLYLVFGRNKFDGYLEKRDEMEAESQRLIRATTHSVAEHIIPSSGDTPLYSSLLSLARMPATRGNEVDLLIDGEATFDSILAGLERAEKYILFQFYIIRDDDLGRRLARVLQDRARAGVQVCLLYDEVGTRGFHKTGMYKQLVMVGVTVAAFNTTQGRRNRFQLNFRNHRKTVVVDGKCAWVGGHNVGLEYLGQDPKIGPWRDTHIRVRGPAVLGTELAFATDWLWATQKPLPIEWNFSPGEKGGSEVLVFPSDPASEYEEAGLMFHQLIVEARHRIWIASPYFVPDRGIVAALQLAALRGVDVRILIPEYPDKRVVAMANWSYTRELLPAGVKVYRYHGGVPRQQARRHLSPHKGTPRGPFMHQKVLLMDDHMAGVGTANFDNRSFRLNFEITLLVHSGEFAARVEQMLAADMAKSTLVTQADFENQPLWFPLAMGVARLFSPVL